MNNTTTVLTLTIAAAPNGTEIGVRVVEEISGAVVEFTLTTDIPAATKLLSPRNYMNNGAKAAAAGDKRVVVTTVEYDNQQALTAGGLASGAIAGALIAGPVGAVIDSAVGATAEPDQTVITYVKGNPVEPIHLDGEVVVGAGIPETVMLAPVPDSTYQYTYLNGVPVLVDTENRKVVYIVR